MKLQNGVPVNVRVKWLGLQSLFLVNINKKDLTLTNTKVIRIHFMRSVDFFKTRVVYY